MATDHTCTELVPRTDLAHDAGRFIAHAALRHVAFTVLEALLQEASTPEVTLTLTVRRDDSMEHGVFTASGHVEAAHA